uniref:PiggyBac transposable element-derived protein domain-containing protein n=1 Tax=Cyprinodon variegatus TaxID=28743 RepID=A0A3Q2DYJ5_CYPVA
MLILFFTISKAPKTTKYSPEKELEFVLTSSEEDLTDSEYDSEEERLFPEGLDRILDLEWTPEQQESESDWEPDAPKERRGPSTQASVPSPVQLSTSTVEMQWHTADEEDVAPPPLVFKPVRQPGPQQRSRTASTPMDFFRLFFTDTVLATLLANTNQYGKTKIDEKKGKWKDLTISDMFSFLAIIIYMGLIKCSQLRDYWKGSRLYNLPFPPSVMSRNKFLTICRALHMSSLEADAENISNKGTAQYDRLGKIKPLYLQIIQACKEQFHPNQHISIDERMVASKAIISIKKHDEHKPKKCGRKLVVLADSETGYTWNFKVFEGKSSGSGQGLSYDSFMSLIDTESLGTGYQLYVKDFYTSPHLFKDLLKKKIGACGTIQQNRVKLPKTVVSDLERNTARRSIQWIRDGKLLYIKWIYTQEVILCSSIHKAYSGGSVKRRVKQDGKWVEKDVPVPDAVKSYNKYMRGVDLSNSLINCYSVARKTRNWYRTFFYHFVDIAVVNAHILYQQCATGCSMTPKQFREALIQELADNGSVSTSQASSLQSTPSTAVSHKPKYFAEGLNIPKREAATLGRRNCAHCHRKTPVGCQTCNVPLCFVSQRDCYNLWHRENGL